MDLSIVYLKKRKAFGRATTHLIITEPEPLGEFETNETLIASYPERTRVLLNVQAVPERSEHWVDPEHVDYQSHGMNHMEGGWPKDIDYTEKDQTARYRKKVEKDEEYLRQIKGLADGLEASLMQNNAVDIYENYFEADGATDTTSNEAPSAKTLAAFKDPSEIKRTACRISWFPDGGRKIAVAFSIMQFQDWRIERASHASYIWDVNSPNEPDMALHPVASLCCLDAYNPKQQDLLVGGLYNGLISFWDTRKGPSPVETSVIECSHRDPVYDICWLAGKTATDCVSTSTDGQVLWWDARKLAEPQEKMQLEDKMNDGRAIGGVRLEYTTAGGKFLVATEQGTVVSCNRKAKNAADRMGMVYEGHSGPVYAVQRSPFMPKFFLTIGDWTWRLWNEELRSPVITSKYFMSYMTDTCWSPARPGVFMTTKMDGTLDVWDIFYKQNEPVLSTQVHDDGLYSVSIEQQGSLLCTGSVDGSVYLLELSEGLTTLQRNEKPQITAMFERESKREKNLDARAKELRVIRAKEAKAAESAAKGEGLSAEPVGEPWDVKAKEVEAEFWKAVGEVGDD